MTTLFPSENIQFELPDAEIVYYPNFFSKEKADDYFQKLKNKIPWQQDEITVYGKTFPQPRLTALFGNE
jgi:alkylated DNA repair dioxygenase AlkB